MKFIEFIYFNKRQRKPKGQSRMDDLKTLATLGTTDTGHHNKNHNTEN